MFLSNTHVNRNAWNSIIYFQNKYTFEYGIKIEFTITL